MFRCSLSYLIAHKETSKSIKNLLSTIKKCKKVKNQTNKQITKKRSITLYAMLSPIVFQNQLQQCRFPNLKFTLLHQTFITIHTDNRLYKVCKRL